MLPPEGSQRGSVQATHFLAQHLDTALVGSQDAAEDGQQRRLAAAGRPDQEDNFPPCNAQAGALEDRRAAGADSRSSCARRGQEGRAGTRIMAWPLGTRTGISGFGADAVHHDPGPSPDEARINPRSGPAPAMLPCSGTGSRKVALPLQAASLSVSDSGRRPVRAPGAERSRTEGERRSGPGPISGSRGDAFSGSGLALRPGDRPPGVPLREHVFQHRQ